MWEEERLKRVEADDEQKRRRQRFNRDTKVALLNQMEESRNVKLEEAYHQELERENIQKQRDQDRNFAQQKQEQFARERRQAMNDIVKFNDNTQASKTTVEAKQKEQELNDLMQKLEVEKLDDLKKAGEKERMRKDMKEYMAYLEHRKAEEKEMERRIEILSQEEQSRTDYKRDVQWEKEATARQNLLDEVYRGRAEQLTEMQERQELLANELYVEKQVIAEEVTRSAELERQEEDEIRRAKLRNQADLIRQMHNTSNQKKMATALVSEERENSIEADRQYRAFVSREKQAAARRNQQMFGDAS